VLGEALATEPDQRFQSIPAFAASLERAGVVATRIRIPRLGRAGVLGAAAVALALGVAGFWVFRRSQGSVESAALRVTELATRAVEGAESAAHPVTAPLARPVQPPAARPVPALPPARREASHTDRAAAPAPSPATGPSGKRRQSRVGNPEPAAAVAAADSAADSIRTRPPDSAGTSLTPAPAPPTWETRAQVYLRIGLDEAVRQLGGPVHAIEGMSPMFIGLASGQLTGGPIVRAVYLDPNGRLILLDQQRIRQGQAVPPATPDRWPIGDVLVSLHGDVPAQTISNLRARVR
ncbi:MAG: hypothetical protein ACJ8DC_05505, partial [Gemmatimonadales bacterium]